MYPLQIAAEFAAYLWFLRQKANAGKSLDEARQFARNHWGKFLNHANAGVGRLLLRIMPGEQRTGEPVS